MQMFRFAQISATTLALATTLMAAASAALVNFENPPYTSGNIIGQDGWAQGAYIGPGFNVNGTANISTASPLTGAQSLVYNQTTSAAGTAASDVAKAAVLNVTSVPGTDLRVSYLIRVTGNGINSAGSAGLFLSNAALSGSSPLLARVDGTGMVASDTGTVTAVPGFVYTPGNVLRVTYDVDFNASNFLLTVFDVTTNTTQFQGTRGFLAGYPATGPGGSYVVDVGTFLRSGTATIDEITLTAVPEPACVVSLLLGIGLAYPMVVRRR